MANSVAAMPQPTATHPQDAPRPLSHAARVRVLAGHTQRSLAATSGVSARQIANLEAGLCRPRLDTALAIAHALGEDDPRVIFPGLDVPTFAERARKIA
jgi:transcriptional regulator with XRE-family HTH domain